VLSKHNQKETDDQKDQIDEKYQMITVHPVCDFSNQEKAAGTSQRENC